MVPSVRTTPWAFPILSLFSLVVLLTSTPVLANIGETKEQLTARYGIAKQAGYENIYTHGIWTINVFFDKEEKSAMEIFSKPIHEVGDGVDDAKDGSFVLKSTKEELFEKQPDLTQDEITQILNDNSGKYGWGGMRSGDGGDFWYRGDRKVIAQYKKKEKALVLMSID